MIAISEKKPFLPLPAIMLGIINANGHFSF